MRKALWILGALVAVQLLILAAYLGIEKVRDGGSIAVERLSRPTPDLALRSADGAVTRIADLRGSTVVLHFWATWCPPCREELPSLLEFASIGTLEVLAVSVDENWRAVRSFVEDESLEYLYLAPADAVAESFGVDVLPQTFVIDSTGTMRLRFRGPQKWNSRALREMIDQ